MKKTERIIPSWTEDVKEFRKVCCNNDQDVANAIIGLIVVALFLLGATVIVPLTF